MCAAPGSLWSGSGGEMRLTVLASGSKGNAALVETPKTRFLIDAGLNCKSLVQRLNSIGVDEHSIDAILLSHEHSDHVCGAGVFSRRFRVPVYATQLTGECTVNSVGDFHQFVPLHNSTSFSLGDAGVEVFSVSHDAADPVGFRISSLQNRHLCYVTDTGIYTSLIKQYAIGCHTLVMESNHDEIMLMEGKYPWPLKQRVRSRTGHASNREASAFLQEVWWDGMQNVILSHLSAENNIPALAYHESKRALESMEASNTQLYGTRQHMVGSTIAV
ncbi:MBL fold metallo-hydrolase [Desulfurispirillum indicum]|uniref:MBL fold metallo-hydrolase n=1 Tax=Desulfurispirillum indicum TaxID=936456 RepID=UPI001CF993AD|nr:MBL fold metallo-hydrolase [Desulfurispirillum indicum]UCZ56938.1 MBL fold metallo-hydrolase [Desulfurispirillum indicum]